MKPQTKWDLYPKIPEQISKSFSDYPAIIRQILYNRGMVSLEDAERFLKADAPIHSPDQLKDMDKAVSAIFEAITQNKKIVVFGDYDVDGITAAVLLVQVLKKFGGRVEGFFPNRFEDGYGLTFSALEKVFDLAPDLIITVDCGVRSVEEIELITGHGIQAIITDHHQPLNIPNAEAVICPKQIGDQYPYKELAGVGLAYKLARALLEYQPIPNIEITSWLDLVAIGTVADLAPLDGENRALVKAGIRQVRFGIRPGLMALSNISGINIHEVTTTDIGFRIGPRLNAAGRLSSAIPAFELLMADTNDQAAPLALELDEQNQKRKVITKNIQKSIENSIAEVENQSAFICFDPSFNEGVIGLAASNIVKDYYRPAIIGSRKNGEIKASCRSIESFNITDALDECASLLIQHGGHAMAAGLSLEEKNSEAFTKAFSAICARDITPQQLIKRIKVESLVQLRELKPDLLGWFDQIEPTGIMNPKPIFQSNNVKIRQAKKVGKDGSHLRMVLTDGEIVFNGIGFGFGEALAELQKKNTVDILFNYELNHFNGNKYLQLNIKDIR